jgi:hypothetical protein
MACCLPSYFKRHTPYDEQYTFEEHERISLFQSDSSFMHRQKVEVCCNNRKTKKAFEDNENRIPIFSDILRKTFRF